MRCKFAAAALALLIIPVAVRAQGGSPADVKAIRNIEAQWQAAWNRHDVAAMVRLGAANADWVNLAGQWFHGRDAFAKSLESLHSGKVKNSIWHTDRIEVRFLTPTIAVVHVYFSSSGETNPNGTPRAPRRGIFTRVEEKNAGRWAIIASQATNIVPAATAVVPRSTQRSTGE